MLAFRILYEDDVIVAVDKPAGYHSHPPEDKALRISHRWNSLAILEKQLALKLYPVHRLDRATSGVFLLSKKREINSVLQKQFQAREVEKVYYCLVRGHLRGAARIENKLPHERGEEDALTLVQEMISFTLPIRGPQGDRRFTLVQAEPVTGRYHQIRRHLARLSLPIVGDKTHGDKKVNREFAAVTGVDRLLLRCQELGLHHPVSGEKLRIGTRWPGAWHSVFEHAGLCPLRASPSPTRPSLS